MCGTIRQFGNSNKGFPGEVGSGSVTSSAAPAIQYPEERCQSIHIHDWASRSIHENGIFFIILMSSRS